MRITDLSIIKLEIPFKVSFSHASATRSVTDSIIVTAHDGQLTGYGEACPRSYVTDETYESAYEFFNEYKASVINEISDINSLRDWVSSHADVIDENPAAWCAIELSLLDMFSREKGCSVELLIDTPELNGDFQYSAVLGDSSIETFSKLLEQYRVMGFTDFKLKLSGDLERDKEKCDVLNQQVSNARVRLDANNMWQNSNEVIAYIQKLGRDFFSLEEPLKANDYSGLLSIAETLDVKIILDESFIKFQQFDYLLDNSTCWIINIRISKMGGLLRSIAIAEQARNVGVECIVGAQVGETSLLTRAALTLMNNYRDIVLAQEGACGTYLLKYDPFRPVLMFGKNGKITQEQLRGLGSSGFGLEIK